MTTRPTEGSVLIILRDKLVHAAKFDMALVIPSYKWFFKRCYDLKVFFIDSVGELSSVTCTFDTLAEAQAELKSVQEQVSEQKKE